MIKFDSKDIVKIVHGSVNIGSVYKNGVKVFGGTWLKPCFGVTYNIGEYKDTKYEHVYDFATQKWYKKQEPRIPTEYTELDYVEANGNQYIVTDYVAKANTTVSLKEYVTTSTLALYHIFSGNQFRAPFVGLFESTTPAVIYKNGTEYRYLNDGSVTIAPYTDYEFKVEGDKVYANDELIIENATPTMEGNDTVPCAVFAYGGSPSTSQYHAKARLYYLTVKEGDTVVRDYVPCYNKSTNKIGLFDTVNQKFWTSTSSLIKGNEVVREVYVEDTSITEPPVDNVTFNTLDELLNMSCPWDGQHAYVNGVLYTYNENRGWRVAKYYVKLPWISNEDIGAQVVLDKYCKSTGKVQISMECLKQHGGAIMRADVDYRFFYYNNQFYWDAGGDSSSKRIYTSYVPYTGLVNVEIGNFYITNLDDGRKKTGSARTFESTGVWKVFGHGDEAKIYSIKIFENDIVVRDLVPCMNPNTNVITMFDKVSKTYMKTTQTEETGQFKTDMSQAENIYY